MKDFGEKVKKLRAIRGLTQEEVCGDQTELSVRQLMRIESGKSIPNLNRVLYIAKQLDVSVGELTDGKSLELPKRYKTLKYLILRTPTYKDQSRLSIKESYFDEIYEDFYDNLPEEEQLVIDGMRSKTDVFFTNNIDFGLGILDDYFEQIKHKNRYNVNDLILIELYFICLAASDYSGDFFDLDIYNRITKQLLVQEPFFTLEDIFILNNLLFTNISLLSDLEKWRELEATFSALKSIMAKTQDFQKKPVLSMMEWKYYLKRFNDLDKARHAYEEALLFAYLIDDNYLAEKLKEEWKKDVT